MAINMRLVRFVRASSSILFFADLFDEYLQKLIIFAWLTLTQAFLLLISP